MAAERDGGRGPQPQGDRTQRRSDAPNVIAPPPLLYVVGLVVGFGLEALLPSVEIPRAVRWPAGALLVLAGLWLAASFVTAFRRARTPVDPRHPATALVTSGPYRFSRNPGYLGMALVYSGIAIATSTLWAFVSLIPTLVVVDRGVIRREERHLETRFGGDYQRYAARTRRWL